MKSSIWAHYDKVKNNGEEKAQCVHCRKNGVTTMISIKGGSTKGMHTHAKSKHNIDVTDKAKGISADESTLAASCSANTRDNVPSYAENSDNKGVYSVSPNPVCKKSKIDHFYGPSKNNSMEAVLARMIAKDGLSFKIFVTSEDLRAAMNARGFQLPKSRATIKDMVMRFANSVVLETKVVLQKRKLAGERFACTADEWTSIKMRRYLNLNIHTFDHLIFNLGLIRIINSMNAEKCADLIVGRLSDYGLVIGDICSLTTDAASVMIKCGRLLTCQHLQCIAHGIHLAVADVFYTKEYNNAPAPDSSLDSENNNVISNSSDSECNRDDDSESDNGCHDAVSICRSPQTRDILPDVKAVIKRVREIVTKFRKHPLYNDCLQGHAKSDLGAELQLVLDNRIRWNSMLTMIERFLVLRNPIRKAAIDLNVKLEISDNDCELLQYVQQCLKPIELAVHQLCKKDCTLIIADAITQFAIDELSKLQNDNNFAARLLSCLQLRITQRMPQDVLLTYKFLQKGISVLEGSKIAMDMQLQTIRYTIVEFATKLHFDNLTSTPTSVACNHTELLGTESLAERLSKKIADVTKSSMPTSDHGDHFPTLVMREIDFYRNYGKRGEILDKVYQAFITMQPTSVEAERAFSAAGLFATKVRSRLEDDTLSNMCLLRKYFQNM